MNLVADIFNAMRINSTPPQVAMPSSENGPDIKTQVQIQMLKKNLEQQKDAITQLLSATEGKGSKLDIKA